MECASPLWCLHTASDDGCFDAGTAQNSTAGIKTHDSESRGQEEAATTE